MPVRGAKVGAGVLLGASGALMYAASWQRWAGACPWGGTEGAECLARQDHRFDFLAPGDPWEPIGAAAQLAGASLVVLALAFVLLPTALTGRRPGPFTATATAAAALSLAALGTATFQSGVSADVVAPVAGAAAGFGWFLVVPALLVRLAFSSRGWSIAAAVSLFLATPLVAMFSYAVGPYDAQPWWEAISGGFTIAAGVCLLGAAVATRESKPRGGDVPAVGVVVS